MAKKKKEKLPKEEQEQELKPIEIKWTDSNIKIAEPYFQRTEKMIKRFYQSLMKYPFLLVKANEDLLNLDGVLVINELETDLFSITRLDSRYVVIISIPNFMRKINSDIRKSFINDFKLLFSLPNLLPTPEGDVMLSCFVFEKIYKVIK